MNFIKKVSFGLGDYRTLAVYAKDAEVTEVEWITGSNGVALVVGKDSQSITVIGAQPGSVYVTAKGKVNGVNHTVEFHLTVEDCSQFPLLGDDVYAPSYQFGQPEDSGEEKTNNEPPNNEPLKEGGEEKTAGADGTTETLEATPNEENKPIENLSV